MSGPDPADRPVLRLVKGDPTAEELAALVAVLARRRSGRTAAGPATPAGSAWASYWRTVRVPTRPGRGAWRASGLPR